MKDVTQEFKQEIAKETNKPIYLYEVKDYDDNGASLYLTESVSNVTFNGHSYVAFPISHERVGDNSKGEVDTLKIKMGNVSRLIESYLHQYEWRGKEVVISIVWLDKLDDTDNVATDSFFIESYTSDQKSVEFNLSSKFSVMSTTIPTRCYSRTFCRWKFKSSECGYSGAEVLCNKTLIRCRELSNQVRFGAFPSIPTRTIYVS